ncbi:MAG: DUF882 domain-containing protein [Myxococcales bacterium]|nr:DUF882 domain-containing protein [Myxococcales bacterium]MCB9530534.1 DUF882 domain-containing protein [Myxococcales bacterium]
MSPPMSVPWAEHQELGFAGGDLATLRGAPWVPNPESPEALVAAAVGEARDNAIAALDATGDENSLESVALNENTDALTEAWLRIDEAIVLTRLINSPLPPPRPVSVERQERARAGRVPPGELHLRVQGHGLVTVQVYAADGRMRPEAVREVSSALRDRRLDRVRTIEPRLIAMLYRVGQRYDSPLTVVSGYRVRGVNATEGSRHGAGHACDFYVEGVGARSLARTVEGMFARVGVGYYPRSGFVHLDDRERTYYWIDQSGPGQRSRARTRALDIVTAEANDTTLQSVHATEEELYVVPPT